MRCHNFTQYIDTPTHIHGNMLDLILTSVDDGLITNVVVYNHNNQPIKSDHFLVSFEIRYNICCHYPNTPNYRIAGKMCEE